MFTLIVFALILDLWFLDSKFSISDIIRTRATNGDTVGNIDKDYEDLATEKTFLSILD